MDLGIHLRIDADSAHTLEELCAKPWPQLVVIGTYRGNDLSRKAPGGVGNRGASRHALSGYISSSTASSSASSNRPQLNGRMATSSSGNSNRANASNSCHISRDKDSVSADGWLILLPCRDKARTS